RFETLAALEKAVAIGRELGQPPPWFDRLRNEAIACLALPDLRPVPGWERKAPATTAWDCDPRHRLYALNELNRLIHVRRMDTDEEIATLTAFPDTSLDFSPDGRFLALDGPGGKQRTRDLASSPPAL